MQQLQPIVINFRGGIVSPGYLKDIMDIAAEAQVSHASFGLRQQLLMNIPVKKFETFKTKCEERNVLFYEADDYKPNIVSSYCTANIFTTESWLSEGVYKDVFDMFTYQPSLKINICDSKQSLVPLCSGHINWISSSQSHFWHLNIRFPASGKTFNWPELIYTNDITRVSAIIEQQILENEPAFRDDNPQRGDILFKAVQQQLSYIAKPVTEQLVLPVFHLPYYEGFNKDGETSWLGIYRRDELFPVDFLREVCMNCLDTKIGQFYTTCWKSIIIKGIHASERKLWDRILGAYRINVRHAANELNWQVEDNNEDGLILKRHIIRHFDIEDVRTYGLSFAVKTRASPGMFGSVIISKQQRRNNSRLKSMDRFEILHTSNFNPNSTDLVLFRKDVEKDHLGIYLVSLCKVFYEQGSSKGLMADKEAQKTEQQVAGTGPSKKLYQCRHCLSVYDESLGEPEREITAGTLFQDLPSDYTCTLCEAPKGDFGVVSASSLVSHGV